MNEKTSGGPAFPTAADNGHLTNQDGMTLRDYFAAKAMPILLADYFESAGKTGFDEDWMMGVAVDSYAMADAMLKAREVA